MSTISRLYKQALTLISTPPALEDLAVQANKSMVQKTPVKPQNQQSYLRCRNAELAHTFMQLRIAEHGFAEHAQQRFASLELLLLLVQAKRRCLSDKEEKKNLVDLYLKYQQTYLLSFTASRIT